MTEANVSQNRSYELSEKLAKARPAIEAQGPPTPEQRKAGADMKGFPSGTPYGDMIGAQAALFDLDHRWWPEHREEVLTLLKAARIVSLTEAWESGEWPAMDDLKAAIAAMDKGKSGA